MKSSKTYIYGTLLALPLISLLLYALNRPQCPDDYTQAQVDASSCIVGANIGGMPLFILSIPLIWLGSVWLIKTILKK